MKLTTAQLDRAAGVLVATAVGDALGAGYEFGPALPSSTPVTMKGGGPFGFAPSEWTDDTSMAIVISNAILDALDAGRIPASRGTFSSTVTGWQAWAKESKDVGAQTSSVLRRASRTIDLGQDPAHAAFNAAREHHEATGRSAGNGSLMRTAPLALTYLASEEALWDAAERFSSLTHFEDDAAEACQLWTAAIRYAVLTGVVDIRVGLPRLRPGRGELWLSRIEVAEASQPRDFKNNGWVVEAFQGAWSAIFHAVTSTGAVRPSSLRMALENAVRGGNDTDTVAAIAGGLIGAAAGYSAIPSEWRRKLHGWGANGARELLAISLELAAGGRRRHSWPRANYVDNSGYPGIGTVVQHPDDAGVWIGGSAQLPYVGYPVPDATGLPAALSEVSAVVSLCRVGAQEAPHIEAENHLSFWLIDSSSPEENAHLEFVLRDAAAAVAAFRAEGRTVYLHCVQAETRTPTVAALYGELMGGDARSSLERVVRALPNAHPNAAFTKVLQRHDATEMNNSAKMGETHQSPEEVSMTSQAKTKVRWEEDELILVCQLQQEAGWQNLSSSDKAVIELSNVLRSMRSVDGNSTVRSPNSVKLKAWDLYSFHPDYVGAAHQGSKMDQAVLHIYLFDPAKGAQKAATIRSAS